MDYYIYIAYIRGLDPPNSSNAALKVRRLPTLDQIKSPQTELIWEDDIDLSPLDKRKEGIVAWENSVLQVDQMLLKKRGRPKTIDAEQIKQLYKSGHKYKEISIQLGISVKTIQRTLKTSSIVV